MIVAAEKLRHMYAKLSNSMDSHSSRFQSGEHVDPDRGTAHDELKAIVHFTRSFVHLQFYIYIGGAQYKSDVI